MLAMARGGADKATVRCELRNALAKIDCHPDDDRLDLCIETASALVCGYRHWIQGQTDIEFYPAWEFSQVFQHDEAIDWKETWLQNGGRLSPLGKMIALKSDLIWVRISMFHLPFPPFDLDSGMRLDGAHRTDAEELGLLAPYHQPQPDSLNVDFEEALRKRVEWYFSDAACQQRFEREVHRADADVLLCMAEERVDDDGEESSKKSIHEALFILEEFFQRTLINDLEQQARAYGLFAAAHDTLRQSEQATVFRLKQLKAFETRIASGVPTSSDQRAKLLRHTAGICDKLGQPQRATEYRQLAEDSRTAYSLFYEIRQRVKDAGGITPELAPQVIRTLEQAFHRGFTDRVPDEVNAWGLLASAHETLYESDKAKECRLQQLAVFESCFASGLPHDCGRRAQAYRQAAAVCEQIGQTEKSATFRELAYATGDASDLLQEALVELKRCGRVIDKKTGTNILEKLTAAAKRIPVEQSEHHAEIYRATGQILEGLGDLAQAVEYYEYALQKNPKLRIKGRLKNLRNAVVSSTPAAS